MCEALGYKVRSLKRVRIINIKLDVPTGKYRELNKEEILELNRLLKNSSKTYEWSNGNKVIKKFKLICQNK